jgi:putative chitinase
MINTLLATAPTLLKSHPLDSSAPNLPTDFKSVPITKGQKVIYKWLKLKGSHYLIEVDSPIDGRFNWYAFRGHFDGTGIESPVVRKDQCEAVFGRAITDRQFQALDRCLKRFDITTIPRVRHFLAQIAHESGGLRWMVELASGTAYEGRRDLGNIFAGDGRRFRGVDALQMTGRANYQAFADFVGDQRVMEGWQYVRDNYLFLPSGFWWYRNKMNALIDRGATVKQVTRRVNGGFNALEDRIRYYEKALQVI